MHECGAKPAVHALAEPAAPSYVDRGLDDRRATPPFGEVAPGRERTLNESAEERNKAPVLDSHDLRLIALMQEDNRRTAEELSQDVGLSASACLRRLKRLREDGVIIHDISVIAPEMIGRHLTMIVEVVLERDRPDMIDAFKQAARATPEVMQCYAVTGDIDFVLVVTVRDMRHYEDLTRRLFRAKADIRRFNTRVVMDRVKIGLGLPVGLAADRAAGS